MSWWERERDAAYRRSRGLGQALVLLALIAGLAALVVLL